MVDTERAPLHLEDMHVIEIHDVPDEVHRTLEERAAQAGVSVSAYLRREITAIARRPTLDEVLEGIRARGPSRVSIDSPAAVREERASNR